MFCIMMAVYKVGKFTHAWHLHIYSLNYLKSRKNSGHFMIAENKTDITESQNSNNQLNKQMTQIYKLNSIENALVSNITGSTQ